MNVNRDLCSCIVNISGVAIGRFRVQQRRVNGQLITRFQLQYSTMPGEHDGVCPQFRIRRPEIEGSATKMFFGTAVEVVPDHGLVVVGAPGTAGGGKIIYNVANRASPALLGAFQPAEAAASTAPAGFGFGNAVAYSDGLLVVGSAYDDTAGTDIGAVWVCLLLSTGIERCLPQVTPPDETAQGAEFGTGVAVSGDIVVVSALGINRIYIIYSTVDRAQSTIGNMIYIQGLSTFSNSFAIEGTMLTMADRGYDQEKGTIYFFSIAAMDLSNKPKYLKSLTDFRYGQSISLANGVMAVYAPDWGSSTTNLYQPCFSTYTTTITTTTTPTT